MMKMMPSGGEFHFTSCWDSEYDYKFMFHAIKNFWEKFLSIEGGEWISGSS